MNVSEENMRGLFQSRQESKMKRKHCFCVISVYMCSMWNWIGVVEQRWKGYEVRAEQGSDAKVDESRVECGIAQQKKSWKIYT